MGPRYSFTAVLWSAPSTNAWVFVSLPADQSVEIRDLTDGLRAGFGSLRVRAAINGSEWRTSVFPDSARGVFVLPVKKAIRAAERLEVGDRATVTIDLAL
jgi:hypothetical protein